MIWLDILKLRMRMPSTARFISNSGSLTAAIGVLAFIFGFGQHSFMAISIGIVFWRGAEWRLARLGRSVR